MQVLRSPFVTHAPKAHTCSSRAEPPTPGVGGDTVTVPPRRASRSPQEPDPAQTTTPTMTAHQTLASNFRRHWVDASHASLI